MIEELPIAADRATGARALHETMSLAREHGLTAYDAAYIELAMRLGLPLATGDRGLATAAERADVGLLGGGESAGAARGGPGFRALRCVLAAALPAPI